jgi:hypothetical protein
MRHVVRALIFASLLVPVVAAVGCDASAARGRADAERTARSRPVSGRPLPAADVLIAAGDSTFWITTGRDGIHVRGAPLTLSRYGGRFYEVYVADDDRSYYDAVFVGQRIFRRDLLSGDSAAVFEDTTVGKAADSYAVRHPNTQPLGTDEDGADEPSSTVTGEVDIVDVHGPFLSYEYRGSRGGAAGGATTVRHGVVDLRSRHGAAVAAVAGTTDGDRIIDAARRAFAAVKDSVSAADSIGADEAVHRAALALRSGVFAFDPQSFTLVDSNRVLGVAFAVPGRGPRGSGKSLALPAIPVRTPTGGWWDDVRLTLPEMSRRAGEVGDLWQHGRTELVARYDSTGDQSGVRVVLRDSTHREWAIGRLPAPTHRVYWLATDSAEHAALRRAFDESALYADDARGVRLERRLAPGGRVVVATALRPGAGSGARPGGVGHLRVEARPSRGTPARRPVPAHRPRPA